MIDLADHFRQETKLQHVAAERSTLMRMFIKGDVPPQLYAEYLAALLPVYASLEAGLRSNADVPLVARVMDPVVFRRQAIEADLAYLRRCGHIATPCAEATIYAERIASLADNDPAMLIAHAYTRYVGDLSGGRMLRRFIAKSLGGTEGLLFYDYDVDDTAELKNQYRERFQKLELDEATIGALTEEACVAFASNHRMFDELATAHAKRMDVRGRNSTRARRDSYAA